MILPPARAGVPASRQYLPEGPWSNLLQFLLEFFPNVPADCWRQRLQQGEILDQQGVPYRLDSRYQAGNWLFYYREVEQEPVLPAQARILYQDSQLLVADKPHWMPVTPSGRFVQQSLLVQLQQQTGLNQLAPVHRIDRETAGLVLFSVQPSSRAAYCQLFQQQQIRKEYLALSQAAPTGIDGLHHCRIERGEPFYRMQCAPGPANSHTQIESLGWHARDGAYRYRLRPQTGKKHQLRLQMAQLGAPILHDPLYPQLRLRAEDEFSQPLQLLAQRLSFIDPFSGQAHQFESQQQLNPHA